MDKHNDFITILNTLIDRLKNSNIEKLYELTDLFLLKDIILEMEPQIEKITKINITLSLENTFSAKYQDLKQLVKCLEKYLEKHDEKYKFKPELNLDSLININGFLKREDNSLFNIVEFFIVLASISTTKDSYLDKLDLLDENLQNVFLAIVEKYIDFAAEEPQKTEKPTLSFTSLFKGLAGNSKPKKKPEKEKESFFGLLLENKATNSFVDPSIANKKENKILNQEKIIMMENLKEYEDKTQKLEEYVFELEKKCGELQLENDDNQREIEMLKESNLENNEIKQLLSLKELELNSIKESIMNKDLQIDEITREHNESIKLHLDEITFLKKKNHEYNEKLQDFANKNNENEKLKSKVRELTVYKQQAHDYDELYNKLIQKDKKIEELNGRIDFERDNLAKVFKDLTIEQDRKKALENKITTVETEYKGLKLELSNLEALLNEKGDGKKEEAHKLLKKMTTHVQGYCDIDAFDPEFQPTEKISEKSENSEKSSNKNKLSGEEGGNESFEGSLDYYRDVDQLKAKSLEDKIVIKKLEEDISKLEQDNIELIKQKNDLIFKLKKNPLKRGNTELFEETPSLTVNEIDFEIVVDENSDSYFRSLQDKNYKMNNHKNKAKKEIQYDFVRQKRSSKHLKQNIIKFCIEAASKRADTDRILSSSRSEKKPVLEIESEIALNFISKPKPTVVKKGGFKNNLCEEDESFPTQNVDKSSAKVPEKVVEKVIEKHDDKANLKEKEMREKSIHSQNSNFDENYYNNMNNMYCYPYYDYPPYDPYYGEFPNEYDVNTTSGNEINWEDYNEDFRSLNIELLQSKISSFNLETENEALKNKIEELNYYIGTINTNNIGQCMNCCNNLNSGGNMYNMNNNYMNSGNNNSNKGFGINNKMNNNNLNNNTNNMNSNNQMNNNHINNYPNSESNNVNTINNNMNTITSDDLNIGNPKTNRTITTNTDNINNNLNNNELKNAIMERDKERDNYIKLIKKLKLKLEKKNEQLTETFAVGTEQAFEENKRLIKMVNNLKKENTRLLKNNKLDLVEIENVINEKEEKIRKLKNDTSDDAKANAFFKTEVKKLKKIIERYESETFNLVGANKKLEGEKLEMIETLKTKEIAFRSLKSDYINTTKNYNMLRRQFDNSVNQIDTLKAENYSKLDNDKFIETENYNKNLKNHYLKQNPQGLLDIDGLQKKVLDLKSQRKIVENELFKIPENQRSRSLIKQKENLEKSLDNINKEINNIKTVLRTNK